MIEWKWKVRALTLRPSLNNINNVIATVHWYIVIMNDGIEDKVVHSNYTYLTPPADGTDFIVYENVTEQDCINWVKQMLGADKVAVYEAEATHQVLALQGVAAATASVLPWQK